MSWDNIKVNNRKPNRSVKMATSSQIMQLGKICNIKGYRLKKRIDIPLYIWEQLLEYMKGSDLRNTRPKDFDTYIDDNGYDRI